MAKTFVPAIMPNPHVVDNVTTCPYHNVKNYVVELRNVRQFNKQARLKDCRDRHRVWMAGPAFRWKPTTNRPAPTAASGLIPDSPDEMAFGQLRAPISVFGSSSYAGSGSRVLTDATGERRKRGDSASVSATFGFAGPIYPENPGLRYEAGNRGKDLITSNKVPPTI